MRPILILFFVLFSTGLMAQEGPVSFAGEGISFSGDNNISTKSKELVELTGNVHFSTSIVEIEKAEKIVYDPKNKTFTISGFKELRLNGKKKLASDLGPTTLKIDLGDCVAYLVATVKACDGKDC